MDRLKHEGKVASARDVLKMLVNTGASWLAQDFSTRPEMPSGPAAFLLFTPLRILLTSLSVTETSDLFRHWGFPLDFLFICW